MPHEEQAFPGILVVDDNPADARLIQEALHPRPIHVAADGPSALAFMEASCPGLVLLDLSLPGMCGHEVLSAIRSSLRWAMVPVVIFSSSDSPDDIEKAYSGAANGYVTKPSGLDEFFETVRRIHRFWLPPR